uniref:FERM domain-containing protein n=1 Tax=Ascaris lumbricoides TaxID=6252 RepID=A0A9J2P047_ASCLU
MEVSIAIVQLRQTALNEQHHVCMANDYDVLLINEPSSSSRFSSHVQFPACRVPHNGQPAEVAFNAARHLSARTPRRAVAVPLWENADTSYMNRMLFPGSPHPVFYCVPLLEKDKNATKTAEIGRFENLARVLNCCLANDESFDIETRHLAFRLEEWLRMEQRRDPHFITTLFLRPISSGRIRSCAHNPAYDPEQSMLCHNMMGHGKNPDAQRKSCDLAEEVRRSNDARAKMIGDEKYDMFIMNPLFGSGLHYTNKDKAPSYFAAGRTERHGNSFSSRKVSGESWPLLYPLHKAAYDDNVTEIKKLLAKGMTANEVDNASWTPLHYCAFYNNLNAMEALLLNTGTDVNIPNKAGSTALHFAALQANVYMVELLLSHSAIDVNARDCKGQRALDVCACVPKAEYQKVAKLLREWNRLDKIQVEMMDGGNAQLALVQGQETSAGQLHAEMCKELKLNSASASLFAIWICSDRLSLQLKADHKPLQHMNKWRSKIAKFGNEESAKNDDDTPKIFFRRDARVALRTEKATKLTPMALSLLYEEARHNYLKGLYPCSDSDVALLASIILHIIYGQNFQLTEKILQRVVPRHRIPTSESALKSLMSRIESEHRSAKISNLIALQQHFLQICWRLSVYGSTFFDAIIFMNKPKKGSLMVHVGVNDYGLHLINSDSKTLINTYPLKGLQWSIKPDRPYLDVHAVAFGHDFTLRTPQLFAENNILNSELKIMDEE